MATTPKILAIGDEITIWPKLASYESRDTEPGAQPWKAKYLGTTARGKLLVQDAAGKYPAREIDTDGLKPS
jgi:hypothetical protein